MTLINYPVGFPKQPSLWKGNTLYQVIASIQFNKMSLINMPPSLTLKPLPLKLYRKEINNITSSTKLATCSVRLSTSITGLDMPGSSMITSVDRSYSNGLVNTLSLETTTLTAEQGLCETPTTCIFSPEKNARRRVRSAGMIPKVFNENRNYDPYFTSTNQYLVSRNRTIKQNEYNYFKQSNMGLLPNIGNGKNNIYRPQGLSHCYRPALSAKNGNNIFTYIWIDGTSNTITIPDGNYEIETLNTILQNNMIANTHYFLRNGVKTFLIVFSYNSINHSVIIICNPVSRDTNRQSYFSESEMPPDATWSYDSVPNIEPYTTNGDGNKLPYPLGAPEVGATYIEIPNTPFADAMGFYPGAYTGGINEAFFTGSITTRYVTLYYKPNNQAFGTQGAVDSSSYIQRAKYNAITNSAQTLKTAYGDAVANALAYGVSEHAYTEKDKVGFKRTAVPVIDKSGKICPNPNFIYRSG